MRRFGDDLAFAAPNVTADPRGAAENARTGVWGDVSGWSGDPAPQAPAREDANRCGRTDDELRLSIVRAERLAALEALWTLSTLKRVRHCRRVRQAGTEVITIDRTEGRASFGGTQTCGSVWACPCCAARILGGRTEELVAALTRHRARGGRVAMVTLTLRHRRREALEDLWDILQAAWAAARGQNRSVREAKDAIGVAGWVRNVEATHGRNGWHLHVHALVFLDEMTTDNAPGLPVRRQPMRATHGLDAQYLGSVMFRAWRGAVKLRRDKAAVAWSEETAGSDRSVTLHNVATMGLPSFEHGWHARMLNLDDAVGEAGRYLAKGEYAGTRGAALEVTAAGKVGRGERNRTPMQILADVVDSELHDDLLIWREWERASKGRRMLTWSGTIRADLALGQEVDDETLAQEGEAAETLVAVTPAGFAEVTAVRGRVVRLARAAESVVDSDGARRAVTDLLVSWGLYSQIRDVAAATDDEVPPAPEVTMRRPYGGIRGRLGIGARPKQAPLRYSVLRARDRYR